MRTRVLKFRIWDVKLKGFISSDHLGGNFGLSFGLDYDGDLRCLDSVREHDKFIVQQSTGLIDKNKREIFEGDLVKADRNHINVTLGKKYLQNYTKGKIVFINEGFNVCQEYVGRIPLEKFVSCGCCPCGLEIIGNIFKENKEEAIGF